MVVRRNADCLLLRGLLVFPTPSAVLKLNPPFSVKKIKCWAMMIAWADVTIEPLQ